MASTTARLELLQAVGTGAGHENSRQHVVAEAGLRIEPRGDADLPAGGQVQQGGHERRGAQVDGNPVGIPLRVARLEVDEAIVIQHGGALEIGVPQAARKLAEQAQIGLKRAELPLQAGQVGQIVVAIGQGKFDIPLANRRHAVCRRRRVGVDQDLMRPIDQRGSRAPARSSVRRQSPGRPAGSRRAVRPRPARCVLRPWAARRPR